MKGRSALQQVMLVGRAVEDRLLIVRYLPAPSATGRRFAVTVSRGIRPAVRRNRLRRQLRELWRQGRRQAVECSRRDINTNTNISIYV